MKIERYFMPDSINWNVLPDLPARLQRFGLVVESVRVNVKSYQETIGFDSLESACKEVSADFPPTAYSIWIDAKKDKGQILICIHRGTNMHGERFQSIEIDGLIDRDLLQSIADFLNLTPDNDEPVRTSLKRSVFIAHRFDEMGISCAEKVARFLELLNFNVSSGRGFSPTSISEKVRARLLPQAIVIAILTPGEDSTWLVQESVIADSFQKPVFLLRDKSTEFKAGVLGDLEFIPFNAPAIEVTFIPLLEGFCELGYFKSK